VRLPGLYTASSSIGLTGPLTLDAQGDPGAVFIFQVGSTLTTASNSSVVLTNGAQACNVFWQIGSSATLGTDTRFAGTVLALTSITANNGASVDGRLLARNGAVTLDRNVITPAFCARQEPESEPTPTPTPTATATAAPTAAPTATPTPTPTPTATAAPTASPTPTPTDGGSAGGGGPGAGTPTERGTSGEVTRVPTGGAATGGGPTSGPERAGLLLGSLLLLAGGAALVVRRRGVVGG
jgi:hypothetical protein